MNRFLRTSIVILAAVLCAAPVLRADAALKAAEEKAKAAAPGEPLTAWVEASAVAADGSLAAGTALREGPDAAAAVLGTFKAGESMAVQRIQGDWMQVRVYPVGAVAPAPVVVAPVAAPAAQPAPVADPLPVVPAAAPAPAPVLASAPSQPVLLPDDYVPVRTFSGTLEPTRGFIWTTPPSKHELIDKDGYRVAFLDLSQLMKTVDIERALGRPVQVSGKVVAVRRGKDVLMTVESLVLR